MFGQSTLFCSSSLTPVQWRKCSKGKPMLNLLPLRVSLMLTPSLHTHPNFSVLIDCRKQEGLFSFLTRSTICETIYYLLSIIKYNYTIMQILLSDAHGETTEFCSRPNVFNVYCYFNKGCPSKSVNCKLWARKRWRAISYFYFRTQNHFFETASRAHRKLTKANLLAGSWTLFQESLLMDCRPLVSD